MYYITYSYLCLKVILLHFSQFFTNFSQKLARFGKIVYNRIRIVVIEMKKILKTTIILIIIITIFAPISHVYAARESELELKEQEEKEKREDQELYEEQTHITEWSGKTTGWWKPGGIVVSVIAVMIIGIKEMTAGVEEKSVIKQALPGYILGVVMVVAITMLPTIIYRIVKGL